MNTLPAAWQEAFRRDAGAAKPDYADPLPERRLARLLAAFIGAGLVFLVLPGTLLGVWNLLRISSAHEALSVSKIWIQSHGHAQLFGWVGSFIIGISLYTVPKFRGGAIRSLAAGWAMFFLWTAAIAARWASALWEWHWQPVWRAAACAELLVALLLVWQSTATGRSRTRAELWNHLVFAGYAGFIAVLAMQAAVVWNLPAPLIPDAPNGVLLNLALWAFCFPVVWGFSTRFLPSFLGLSKPGSRSAYAGLACLAAAVALLAAGRATPAAILIAGAVGCACWSLRIFHPAGRPAKTIGVDPHYPAFVRLSYGWLAAASVLAATGRTPGLTGASRHAFTVGFLATLIFALGPRILPSFLNSRELWSKRLMPVSLLLLGAGCLARVVSEPLAYSGLVPAAWHVLPVSAMAELAAVLLFAWNIARTLASPVPAWIVARTVREDLPLYWYVSSYPETRRLLVRAGLKTLERSRKVPWSLTLREAAEADGIASGPLILLLREHFARRMARTLRAKGDA
ncbi:MAG: NnrS family protein [Acidobacteria bacterium]|nr:NnrS family protein [Acidobacteriota bacterium]